MSTLTVYTAPPSTIEPAPFQHEDMAKLELRDWSANWSEMGCYKTSTVCWLIPKWLDRIGVKPEDARILMITTRSGKGTFFKHCPDLNPEYNLFNLTTNQCRLRMVGQEFPLDYVKLPGIYVGHYNVLSRRKKKKKQDKNEKELQKLQRELANLSPDAAEETVTEIADRIAELEGIINGTVITEVQDNIEELEEDLPQAEDPEDALEMFEELSMEQQLLEDLLGELLAPPKPKEGRKALIDELLRTKWHIIILDEGHRIKERRTGWTKEIKRLKGQVKHVMTGTGFINDPSEIWSLLNFCSPVEYASYWSFRERFCAEDLINGFRKVVGIHPDHKEEFRSLVRQVGPRRTKREVFKNLPEPIYTPYEVELNAQQRRMYDEIRDELMAMDEEGQPLYAPSVLAALQRLRQISVATPRVLLDYYDPTLKRRVQKIKLEEPSSKLDCLMDILEGLSWDRERRDQVVVFSNFKDPLEMLKVRLGEKIGIDGRVVRDAVPYLQLRQQDNDNVRFEKWAHLFPQKKHQVFMSTIQLGSESISLTSASTCVFLDRSWSPKDNSQAESRVWRPGQEEVANIIHINAKNTIDNRVMQSNQIKTGWFREIFG